MAKVELAPDGWVYAYASLEAPRRGREMFRPVVPIRFTLDQPAANLALVDSDSEHTQAPRWLADDVGVDLEHSNDRLALASDRRPLRLGGVRND